METPGGEMKLAVMSDQLWLKKFHAISHISNHYLNISLIAKMQ